MATIKIEKDTDDAAFAVDVVKDEVDNSYGEDFEENIMKEEIENIKVEIEDNISEDIAESDIKEENDDCDYDDDYIARFV